MDITLPLDKNSALGSVVPLAMLHSKVPLFHTNALTAVTRKTSFNGLLEHFVGPQTGC